MCCLGTREGRERESGKGVYCFIIIPFPGGECRAARARINGEALRRQRGKAQLEDSQQEHIGRLTVLPDLARNYAPFIGRAERGSGSGGALSLSLLVYGWSRFLSSRFHVGV